MHALSTTRLMSKITRSAISRKPINQNQKKKVILDNLFLHLSANFEVKIQNTQRYRSRLTFWHLKNQHLMAQQMAPRWDTQKSKIG